MERPCLHPVRAERRQPAPHLTRCLVRERDREDLAGCERARRDLVCDPARDRRRLARARAGQDAQRTARRLHGSALLGIQP